MSPDAASRRCPTARDSLYLGSTPMRHVVPRVLTLLGLVGAAWLVVYSIGRTSALQSAEQTIAAQKEANAALVEAHARHLRDLARADSLRVEQARQQARAARRDLNTALLANTALLDSARAVLADSAATVADLRAALATTVTELDSLVATVNRYAAAQDSVEAVHQRERVALYAVLAAKDSTIAAKNVALAGYKQVARQQQRARWRTVACAALGGAGGAAAGDALQQPVIGAVGGILLGTTVCR